LDEHPAATPNITNTLTLARMGISAWDFQKGPSLSAYYAMPARRPSLQRIQQRGTTPVPRAEAAVARARPSQTAPQRVLSMLISPSRVLRLRSDTA
jgi:hypothetical protein